MQFDYSREPGKTLFARQCPVEDSPLMSIVTPFYNAGKYFEQTFHCVLNQTFPWFEWIIVNDGSTSTEDVEALSALAAGDRRITVLHKENGGAAGARKYGIRHSSTEIIVFLDADDLIESEYLEYLYFALRQNPEVTWCYTDSCGFGEKEYLWQRYFSSDIMKSENLLPYASAIRKEVFDDDSLYDSSTKNLWEDYQFWLKLLAKGYYPARIPIPLFWYRRVEGGMLSKIEQDSEVKQNLMQRIKELASAVPDGILAKTYPVDRYDEFISPTRWPWERQLVITVEPQKRILLLVPHLEVGGADKFNLDIVRELHKRGYYIGILLTTNDQNDIKQSFQAYCQEIFDLPKFLNVNDWPGFLDYYIKSRQIGIILNISSFWGYYAFPWLRKNYAELKLIDYVHADAAYWRNGGYARVSSAFQDIIEITIAANQVTKDIMVEQYGENEAHCLVSYIGTDESYFNPELVSKGTVRRQYGIAEDRPILLFLSRLSQEKRPILYLEIISRVKNAIPNLCGIVVGDGPVEAEMQEYVKRHGLTDTVIFAGKQEEVRAFYQDADLLLITSIKEGLTLTTFEAMAMKLPIISADVGGQREAVTTSTGRLIPCLQDERTELYSKHFPEAEVQGYVDAAVELLHDRALRLHMGEQARSRVQEKFSFQKAVSDLLSVFNFLDSEEARACRKKSFKMMNAQPSLVREVLCLYSSYEAKQCEATELWNARTWFMSLYENEKAKHSASSKVHDAPPFEESEAQRQLAEIYQMRSWKLVQRYRYFMDNTVLGSILRKMRALF